MSSGLEHKIVQTAVSKHLGIVPKIRGGCNSAKVWVRRASSAAAIVCLVYSVMLCGVPVKCFAYVCPVVCAGFSLPGCLNVNKFILNMC